MDSYEALTNNYPGFTLSEIKGLSSRERSNWINRAIRTMEAVNGLS
jgi:hypothetical protein